jgi:pilus assembly protein Flp/PilA
MILAMQQVEERGATAIEYGLFVALVATVIIVGVAALGQSTLGLFQPVTNFFASLPH